MLHRLPEQHECLFDHLGRGRQEAVLKMVKLDRKVGRSCQRIGEECSWASPHSEEPPCSDCVLALAGFIFSVSFFFSEKKPHFYLCLDCFPLALTWSYPCCWRGFWKNPYPGTMELWTAKGNTSSFTFLQAFDLTCAGQRRTNKWAKRRNAF